MTLDLTKAERTAEIKAIREHFTRMYPKDQVQRVSAIYSSYEVDIFMPNGSLIRRHVNRDDNGKIILQ